MAKQDAIIFESEVNIKGDLRVNKDIIIGDKSLQETIKDSSVGKTTEYGGEIFNDYENNIACAEQTSASGAMTRAGSNAFSFAKEKFFDHSIDISGGAHEVNIGLGLNVDELIPDYQYSISAYINKSLEDTSTLLGPSLVWQYHGNEQFRFVEEHEDRVEYQIDFTLKTTPEGAYYLPEVDVSEVRYGGTLFVIGSTKLVYSAEDGQTGGDGWYYVTTTEGLEDLVTERYNPEYTIVLTNNFDFNGVIKEVGFHNDLPAIKVTNYLNPIDSTRYVVTENSYILLVKHPELGDTTIGYAALAEGYAANALGAVSHAEGYNTLAAGKYSHAEGRSTQAGYGAHAEGNTTRATGEHAHSEGAYTEASGGNAHAEGYKSKATGAQAHATGKETVASGDNSFSAGYKTQANGLDSVAIGNTTKANGNYSFAGGQNSIADGVGSVALGINTHATADGQIVVGRRNAEDPDAIFIVGISETAYGKNGLVVKRTGQVASGATAESNEDLTNKQYVDEKFSSVSALIDNTINESFTSLKTELVGKKSVDGGELFNSAKSAGIKAHAEGDATLASGSTSHAEGQSTEASGLRAHAEGYKSKATSQSAHAQGNETTASNFYAHAEGNKTVASGAAAHAEGSLTTAKGGKSHAGGQESAANGERSFVHGLGLTASVAEQVVFGKYNIIDKNQAFILGNGTDGDNRRNIFSIDTEGRTVVGEPQASSHAATKEYVDNSVNAVASSAIKAEAIAYGKNGAVVFENVDAMNAWTERQILTEQPPMYVSSGDEILVYSFDSQTEVDWNTYNFICYVTTSEGEEYQLSIFNGPDFFKNRAGLRFNIGGNLIGKTLVSARITNDDIAIDVEGKNPLFRVAPFSYELYSMSHTSLLSPYNIPLGTNFYIVDTSVPDYWWDGFEAQQLETQKVNLTEYATKEELNEQVSSMTQEFNQDLLSIRDGLQLILDSLNASTEEEE